MITDSNINDTLPAIDDNLAWRMILLLESFYAWEPEVVRVQHSCVIKEADIIFKLSTYNIVSIELHEDDIKNLLLQYRLSTARHSIYP